MLPDSLITNRVDPDITYRLVKYLPDGSYRINTASPAGLPQTLTIQHTVSGSNGAAVDRHLIKFVKNVAEASGKVVPITMNVSFIMPRSAAATPQILQSLVDDFALLFMSQGYLGTAFQTEDYGDVLVQEILLGSH